VAEYLIIWIASQVVGGFFVWVCGYSNLSVIGASGVIMGFFASIILRAWIERTFLNIIWLVWFFSFLKILNLI
jgi:membrane associated rhomboid family serine protease